MLATSRVPLRIDGEQSVPLTRLPSAAAVELFVERARAVKPEFELTDDNAADVTAIVTALDNVPLALELAAARLRVLTPAASVRTAGPGAAAPRRGRARPSRAPAHPSSHDRLECPVAERPGAGPSAPAVGIPQRLPLDAAEWMCEGLGRGRCGGSARSTRREQPGAGAGPGVVVRGSRCSRRSESTRGTSLERRGDLQKCEQRHAEFFSRFAAVAEPHLTRRRTGRWIARLRDEFEDIRGRCRPLLWPPGRETLSCNWSGRSTGSGGSRVAFRKSEDWIARLADE